MATTRPLSNASPTLDNITAKAAAETTRYTALCNDLDDVLESANIPAADIATLKFHSLPLSPLPLLATMEPDSRATSHLLGLAGQSISMKRLLDYRSECQSGIGTKSARANSEKKKITPKEATHRLCVAQELNSDLKKYEQKKTCQIRWETAVKKMEETLTATQVSIPSFALAWNYPTSLRRMSQPFTL
jgi:hypothetical protein